MYHSYMYTKRHTKNKAYCITRNLTLTGTCDVRLGGGFHFRRILYSKITYYCLDTTEFGSKGTKIEIPSNVTRMSLLVTFSIFWGCIMISSYPFTSELYTNPDSFRNYFHFFFFGMRI